MCTVYTVHPSPFPPPRRRYRCRWQKVYNRTCPTYLATVRRTGAHTHTHVKSWWGGGRGQLASTAYCLVAGASSSIVMCGILFSASTKKKKTEFMKGQAVRWSHIHTHAHTHIYIQWREQNDDGGPGLLKGNVLDCQETALSAHRYTAQKVWRTPSVLAGL